MRLWSEIVERVRSLFRGSREDRDLDEEIAFHLEMETEKNVRQGMGADEARRRAHVSLGGAEQVKEDVRDARGLSILDEGVQDLRFGLRVLRNRPAFATTVVVTLAVGIGLSTSLFSFADAVLLRPPRGVIEPSRLVGVEFRAPHLEDESTNFSRANLQDLREMDLPALSHLIGWISSPFHVAVPGSATTIREGVAAVGNYFEALGVRASEGRLFGEEENEDPGQDIVVISERVRLELFGDEGAVGETLTVNGVPFTVVGVVGGGFRGLDPLGPLDLWVPYATYPSVRHRERVVYYDRVATNLDGIVARLAPRASTAEAESQLRQGMDRLVERYPEVNGRYVDYRPTVLPHMGVPRDYFRPVVALLMTAAGLFLVVACANVSNLLVFSGVRRRGESAARRVLGASRLRLVRQHLTESLLLAAGGVAGGLLLARALVELAPRWLFPPSLDAPSVVLDQRAAAFAVAAGAASVLLAGLLPAVLVGHGRLAEVLKGSARTGTVRRGRLRSILTVTQIAVSLGLVVAALLLDRTVRNLYQIDLGYDPEGVALVRIDPEPLGYEEARAVTLRMDLLRLAGELPGVEAVGGADEGPLRVDFSADLRSGDDVTEAWPVRASRDHVTPGYFGSLGVPLVHGRTFTEPELARSFDTPPEAAVLSETLALRLFGTTDAVGRTLVQRNSRGDDVLEVVGVVADHRVRSLEGPPESILYLPLGSGYSRGMVLTLRTSRPVASVVHDVRALMDRLDPTLPFYEAGSLASRVRLETFDRRLLQRLIGLLATLAAILAGVGLYGVVAHSVAERAREIGIRMALGARRASVIGGIVRQSLSFVGIGIVVGAGVAWLLIALLGRWLYGVTPLDLGVWLLTAAVFLLLGVVSAAGPARSAARVDPMKVLAD